MLARQGSRLITLESAVFRWAVAPDDGFIDIIAELAGVPGCRLEVQADYEDRPDDMRLPGEPPHRIVMPALMSQILKLALESGWRPDDKGPPLRFRLSSDQDGAPTLIPWGEYSRSWTKEHP